MKNIISTIYFILLASRIFPQIPFPDLERNLPDIDTIIVGENRYLELEGDTVFVINPIGVKNYNRTVSYLRNETYVPDLDLVIDNLGILDKEFSEYRRGFIEMEGYFKESLANDTLALNSVIVAQHSILDSLQSVKKDIIHANNLIRKNQKLKIGKILSGSGGVVLGLIIGFLIGK